MSGPIYLDQIAARIKREVAPDPRLPDAVVLDHADHYWPLFRIYAVLCLAKGVRVTVADVHDAWSAWQAGLDEGHRSLRPFAELSPEVQVLDQPFAVAIRRVARALRAESATAETREEGW